MSILDFPQTLSANTVVGRLGTSPGPAEAIPFATLNNNLGVRTTAVANYYVRVNGNDANTGLNDTVTGAWASIAHAINAVRGFDLANQNVVIHVGPGTYNETVTAYCGPLLGGSLELRGDTATPANVVLNYTGGATIYAQSNDPFSFYMQGFKIVNSSNFSIDIDGGFMQTGLIDWGASWGHIFIHNQGIHYSNQAETCSGGGGFHWAAASHSLIRHRGPSMTFTGTPNFTQAFLSVSDGSNAQIDGMTWVSTFTGKRFEVLVGSSILTVGPGVTPNLLYFPGTISGDLLGGFYDNLCSSTQVKPLTFTGNGTINPDTYSVIINNGASTTMTLPAAATYPGRIILIKTIQAQTVISAGSNVVPLVGGGAGTAILAATAGKWAQLQSDGTSWIIMAGN